YSKTAKKKKPPTTYYLATLNKDVDLRHLPTAYSTAHPPRPELCDSCGCLLVNNNSTVFACGHDYHIDCYRGKCTHCEEKILMMMKTMWKVRKKSLRM
ncbi:hypothetical protein C2G38_2119083, partial [Gigaspora rosea]